MSAIEWMLLERLLPLASWLHMGLASITVPHQLIALALLGAVAAAATGLLTVTKRCARRVSLLVRGGARTATRAMASASRRLHTAPQRLGTDVGGRGARAPGGASIGPMVLCPRS